MVGFATILVAPGYLVAAALNLFQFRTKKLSERLAWSIALSFAVSATLFVLLARVAPIPNLAILFDAFGIAALILIVMQQRGRRPTFSRDFVMLGIFVIAGVAILIGSLIDIQQGGGLYLSVTTIDQAFRVAFINGIAHTGVPPLNPLYHPGSDAPMRYYYYWYALCGLCMKVAHVSARQALIASSCWVAIGLVAIISLYARHFFEVRDRLYRFILVAALLLTVTGLDILPVLYNLIVSHDFSGDLEWWSNDQIASWFDSIAWVPNHTASLLSCLAAFLLLWRIRDGASRRDAASATALAGIAAASAFGMSIYVAAGFAMLMAGWAGLLLFRGRGAAFVRRLAAAVAVATLLLIPYLREMLGSHSGTQERGSAGASHLFQFSVRKMIDSGLITDLPIFRSVNQSHPILLDQLVRLLLLLPGYALELGIFGLVLLIAVRVRRTLTDAGRTALVLSVSGLMLVSFVRSSVIGNNDFGYRAAMIPSFFLLLLAARQLTSPGPKVWLKLLLVVGLAGTGFQILMLRVYVPLHVSAKMPGFVGLPEAAFAARSAFESASPKIPDKATVQSNLIDPQSYFYVADMLYSDRAMVADAAVDCGSVFGGDPAACGTIQHAVREIFSRPAISAAEAVARCRAVGVDFLAVGSKDPAWDDKAGWVWTLQNVSGQNKSGADSDTSLNSTFRVVYCGATPPSIP